MANWVWPHTPTSNWARMVLREGPFHGEQAGWLPPDVQPPLELAWTGWFPWGFACYRYVLHQGEVLLDAGRVTGLIYRFRPGLVREVPPVVAQDADLYADAAEMLLRFRGFPGIMADPDTLLGRP